MPIESLFPTRVYTARLQARGGGSLRSQLLRECRQLRLDDRAGRRWSAVNYPGGYTSYGTANRMPPNTAPTERISISFNYGWF